MLVLGALFWQCANVPHLRRHIVIISVARDLSVAHFKDGEAPNGKRLTGFELLYVDTTPDPFHNTVTIVNPAFHQLNLHIAIRSETTSHKLAKFSPAVTNNAMRHIFIDDVISIGSNCFVRIVGIPGGDCSFHN